MAVNPYMKYKEQSVMTMTQGEMLVRLYEEVISQLKQSVLHMEDENFDGVSRSLQKAQKIITHLKATLNFDYEISRNLSSLYDFFNVQIIKGNVRRDPKPIQEIIPLVDGLRDAYSQGERLIRMRH